MIKIIKFCNQCDGMIFPTKLNGEKILKCNLCGNIKKINEELVDSYTMTTKIIHPIGNEFKNLEKLKNWKEKELYKKHK